MVLGEGCRAATVEEAIVQAYNRGETDEYICPTVICDEDASPVRIQDHDGVYFINARSDRARQITKAFVQPLFEQKNPGAFIRKQVPQHTRFVAMTDFGPDLPGICTAFPSPDVPQTLAHAIGTT